MRILFTIAHFFNPNGRGKHASERNEPQSRLSALTTCLTALRGLYGKSQCMIHIGECATMPANQTQTHEIEVVVCTTQNYHLVPHLPLPKNFFVHHATNAEPMMLGFECQAVLQANLGNFDYYCYLEDDLILHDPWLFVKLNWFTRHAGNESLLQPNRYEISPQGLVTKVYIDGDLMPHLTARFQNVQEQPLLTGQIMEQTVHFQRTLNPHAGCYFLNAEQMASWTEQPHFSERDTSFISPLESAATLGIMRTFKIYKPAPPCASFLEIQHFGNSYLTLVGKQVALRE
ncbi:MAG: calcium-binding protein [Actinomycetota bacterium]